MTAPPPHMPIFTASYLLPSSSVPNDTTPWPLMAPLQPVHAPRQQRKSSSPSTNESNGSDLLFITGNKPSDFKQRTVMTKVRKKAMGSYLEKEKEKKPRNNGSALRSRLQSDESSASRASLGSESQEAVQAHMSTSEALKIYRGESRRPAGPQSSSSTPSPVPNSHDSHHRDASRTRDLVRGLRAIVEPMRANVTLIYDLVVPQPIHSIGEPLDPFRTMFNPPHSRISVGQLKLHCSEVFGTKAMGQYWIPALVKAPHAFLSTLCIASAHLDALNDRQVESVQTAALQHEVLRFIHQSILNSASQVDDLNIIAVTQIIASDIIAGKQIALAYHESGVERMVKMRGGLNQLGVDGRLASTLSWVSLESAILREAAPLTMYTDYCASTCAKSYPSDARIPESPLFKPRTEFDTLRRSQRCNTPILNLLDDVWTMTRSFLQESKRSRYDSASLRSQCTSIASKYHPISELQRDTVLRRQDWMYEAIRLTSLIQSEAIKRRTPLSEAIRYVARTESTGTVYTGSPASKSNECLVSPLTLRHDSPVTNQSTSPLYATSPLFSQPNTFNFAPSTPAFFAAPAVPTRSPAEALLVKIKTAIQNSEALSDCWSDMAGVLLWTCLVVGAASRNSDKVLKKWFSALAVRCSIILCFEHLEPMHATVLRMSELVEALGYPAKPANELVRGGSNVPSERKQDSAGKRQRR